MGCCDYDELKTWQVGQKQTFFDPLPLHLGHVFIEWPLSVKLLVEKLTAMMEIFFFIALITSKVHTKLYVCFYGSPFFFGKIVMGAIENKLEFSKCLHFLHKSNFSKKLVIWYGL